MKLNWTCLRMSHVKPWDLKATLMAGFPSNCKTLHLLLCAAKMCSWVKKKVLNGGEPERNGWSHCLLLMFFLQSWSCPMGYDSNWTIVPLLAKSETRSRTPGLSDTASWKMEFQLLEIKSPQQQMEVETNEKRKRKMVGGGKKTKNSRKTEAAGSQSGSYTVNKISLQGA